MRVGGHLPYAKIDRFQSSRNLMKRLVAGERAESVNKGLSLEQTPKLFRAASRQGVFDNDAALQAPDIAHRVITRNPLPARIIGPIIIGSSHFVPILCDPGTAFPFCFAP